MIKIENINNNVMKKEKAKESKRNYYISISQRNDGFEARTTLKIVGGGVNPRITAYSSVSIQESVYKLLLKIENRLLEYKNMNLLNKVISTSVYNSLMESIHDLGLSSNMQIMLELNNIFQMLNEIPVQSVNIQNINTDNNSSNKDFIQQNDISIKPINIISFEDVAFQWFKYKLSLTKKSEDNPKPLSPKTVQGYYDILTTQVMPFFKDNKDITSITEDYIKKCINSMNGFRNKEFMYILLKMIFEFALDNNWVFSVPKIKKPKKPYTDKEQKLIFIETERQEYWLNCFEEENTDMSMLFETMLLTGIRPEEACGLKWSVLKEDSNEIIINNAYKDVPIYNEDCKIIGHKRIDDRLKTPQSYRTIPLNPRLKRRLLEHKEQQIKIYKEFRLKWHENCYMFLNQYRKPYIPENLADNMVKFIKKYKLEHMTPYGLRHSFATYCSEQGMDQVVLMRLMGHSDFNTTQQYYICVSSKRKKQAIQKAYKDIYEKENKIGE